MATNNLSNLKPTSAYWEIRALMYPGYGGYCYASGTATGTNFSQYMTGRNQFFGYDEYAYIVSGLNVPLNSPGVYWFTVVPQDPTNPTGRSSIPTLTTRLIP